MAKVIAVMNEKGGVGKSATATTLACLLAKRGHKTALIDFDGQGHASIIYGVKNTNKLEVTINTLIRKVIEEEPLPEPDSYMIKTECGVDVIPSNSQLFTLERNLCNVDFRERMLSRYVDTIKGSYEYIIIDCMPQMGTLMINVMNYQTIRKNSNHRLRIDGILITMDSSNTILSGQVHKLIEQGFAGKVPIFKTHIPRSIKVAEAVLYHKTICEFLPENPAAVAYERFADEFLAIERTEETEVCAVG